MQFKDKKTIAKTKREQRTYVDDGAGFVVLEAHVGGSSTEDAEGGEVVDFEHHLELLVSSLVKHAVKGVSGIVDDDVDLAESLNGLVDEAVGEGKVSHVSRDSNGLSTSLDDLLGNSLALDYIQV